MKGFLAVALMAIVLSVVHSQPVENRSGGDSGEAPSGKCTNPDPLDHTVHLPHPSNCNHFYRCDQGIAKEEVCPSSLHFNPKLQVCDWPDNAGCKTGSGSGGGDDGSGGDSDDSSSSSSSSDESIEEKPPTTITTTTTTTSTTTTTPATTVVDSGSDSSSSSSEESGDGDGSVGDGSGGDSDADDSSSSSSSSEESIETKPPTTSTTTTTTTSTTTTTPATTVVDSGSDSSSSSSEESGDGDSSGDGGSGGSGGSDSGEAPSGKCPNPDPLDHTVHLPHPSNCNHFYRCDHGIAKEEVCPSNLHFNPKLQVCDWPNSAGCKAQ